MSDYLNELKNGDSTVYKDTIEILMTVLFSQDGFLHQRERKMLLKVLKILIPHLSKYN